jgi:hypothetical protein
MRQKRGRAGQKPRWDDHHRTLWWAAEKVRTFQREGSGQMAVVERFHTTGWERSVDVSSLIPTRVKRTKQWIRNVVKNLNRSIRPIKFRADGSSLCIAWSEADQ